MPPSTSNQPSPKRQKPNVGSALRKPPGPDFDKGIEYWTAVEASVDGVLGGFGTGPVPHIEQLSSRLLLLSLLPSLHKFPSPLTPLPPPTPQHRLTVLDVGAGIGRVSRETLLPLFEDVILLEPVGKFVEEAYKSAREGVWRDLPIWGPEDEGGKEARGGKGGKGGKGKEARVGERGKRVWFVQAGLQGCDPAHPSANGKTLGVVGDNYGGEAQEGFANEEGEVVYDVVWCQWCLGHIATPELITFLKKCRQSLRDTSLTDESRGAYESLLFVKENCCEDGPGGSPVEFLDVEDSSLTSAKWVEIFRAAGLEVVKEEVQVGMPSELFVVKAWALR